MLYSVLFVARKPHLCYIYIYLLYVPFKKHVKSGKRKDLNLLVGWVHDSCQKIVAKRIKPYKPEMRFEFV